VFQMGVTFESTIDIKQSEIGLMQMEQRRTMVNEPEDSVGPTFLNFFEEYLCIRPRNRQARNRGYVLRKCAIGVFIRRESRGCGIARIHGEELD
jgi:hypothetical protein